MSAPVVTARNVGKTYSVYATPWDRVGEALLGRSRHRDFVALTGVDFDLSPGEGLGVIGENGAGKSTLLKMLAGIVTPSAGTLAVRGKAAAILELGSGFHPEFTGRQNIRLNAAMLGLTAKELERKTPRIIDFSELGDFIDRPVKTYSTGMAMRLGFAIATQVEPDVLIIDEALSVGDGYFQKKCMDHIQRFLDDGGTLLFCSHAMYYVSAFCRRALWLRNGEVASFGPAEDVIRDYEVFLQTKSAALEGGEDAGEPDGAPVEAVVDSPGRRPARIAEIRLGGEVRSRDDEPLALGPGDPLDLVIEWETADAGLSFHLGVGLNRTDDVEVASFSTLHEGVRPWTGGTVHRARLTIPELPLVKGEFTLYVYLLDEAGLHVHDQKVLYRALRMVSSEYRFGVVRIAHSWDRLAVTQRASATG
ncbi:MAG: ABC transporter ATP-binding protein [Acidobacteriota bacterium]|jgi:ABC-type polysaccharide/polyol phosphate transport system ATPase subunit